MARIRLSLPDHFPFSTELTIRVTDLNYGGHAGNDSILALIHEARVQFLKHLGYEELNLGGPGLIMSDAALEFRNELFYGDTVAIGVATGDFTRVGFSIYYKLEKNSVDNPVMIALAQTGMVCYDYSKKRIVSIPPEALLKLQTVS